MPVDERARYVEVIAAGSWGELAGLADQLLTAADADLSLMQVEQRRLQSLLSSLRPAALQLTGALADRGDWPRLRDQVVALARERGLSPAAAEELADQAARRRPVHGVDALAGLVDEDLAALLPAGRNALASRAGALWARVVADLNTAPAPSRHGARDADTWTERVDRQLAERWADLVRAWSVPGGDLDAAAAGLTGLASTELRRGARLATAVARRRATKDDEAEVRRAIGIGTTIRSLVEADAAARLSRLVASGADGGSAAASQNRGWARAARRTAHAEPELRERGASTVRRHPDQPSRIVGVVGPVSVRHRRDKAVSTLTLTDLDGRDLPVAMPYIKLDSGGLVAGAAVELTGLWRRGLTWLDGADAFVPARADRPARTRAGLHDLVALELASVFVPVPHGLRIRASLQPGIDGAANPLRYGVWRERPERPRGGRDA